MLRLSQIICLAAVMSIIGFGSSSLQAQNQFTRAVAGNGIRLNVMKMEKNTIRLNYVAQKWQWHTFADARSAVNFQRQLQAFPGIETQLAAGPNNSYYVNYRCLAGAKVYGGEFARTLAAGDLQYLVGLRMQVNTVFLK